MEIEHSTQSHNFSYQGYNYYARITSHPNPLITPIFFVSGAFQTMTSWSRFEQYFSKLTTVITADLPGIGQADYLPEKFGLDFYVETIKKILQHENIKKIFLVAASYGSPIGYRFAQTCPEMVERMVLTGMIKAIPEHKRSVIARTLTQIKQGKIDQFIDTAISTLIPEELKRTHKRTRFAEKLIRNQLRKYTPSDKEKYLANTQRLLNIKSIDLNKPPSHPTLVFTGEYDDFTRPEDCHAFSQTLPNSKFLAIENAGHLFHIEQFEVTTNILHKFACHQSITSVKGLKLNEELMSTS